MYQSCKVDHSCGSHCRTYYHSLYTSNDNGSRRMHSRLGSRWTSLTLLVLREESDGKKYIPYLLRNPYRPSASHFLSSVGLLWGIVAFYYVSGHHIFIEIHSGQNVLYEIAWRWRSLGLPRFLLTDHSIRYLQWLLFQHCMCNLHSTFLRIPSSKSIYFKVAFTLCPYWGLLHVPLLKRSLYDW